MAKRTTKKIKATGKSKLISNTRSVGLLHTGLRDNFYVLVDAMLKMAEGDLQKKNPDDTIKIYEDGYYAADDPGLLQDLADKLVNETGVEVIVAAGGPQSAIAAMEATQAADDATRSEVSIVFTTVAEPDNLGLVDSLDEPGRNATGIAGQTSENDPMRLRLLRALVYPLRPQATQVGVLINPGRQRYREQFKPVKEAAKKLKLKAVARRANTEKGIERAFKDFSDKSFLGVVVTADSFFNNNRKKVIATAADCKIPTIYQWRQFAEDGGLISYGPSIEKAYEEAGKFVAKILLGKKPAKLECFVPAEGTFELVVNGATAEDHLGIKDVPDKLLNKTVTVI